MLQPTQLNHVVEEFSSEIKALRLFFGSTSIPLQQVNTLTLVADRLLCDPAFQRDLSSYLWIALHKRSGNVSHAELLGAIAVAAAGTEIAAAAESKDTRNLLLFVLEVREDFNRGYARQEQLTDSSREPAFRSDTGSRASVIQQRPAHSLHGKPDRAGRSKLRVAVLLSACTVTFLVCALWLYRGLSRTKTSGESARSTVDSSQNFEGKLGAEAIATLPVIAGRTGTANNATQSKPLPHKDGRPLKEKKDKDRFYFRSAQPVMPAAPVKPQTPNFVSLSQPIKEAADAPALSAPRVEAVRKSTPSQAVPSGVLSQRLGARPLPSDAVMDAMIYDAKHPVLLRRKPQSPLGETDGSLVASNEGLPGFRATNVAVGTIRPISLGTMAANIVFSPIPAYPAAAAEAHVQGEVTLRAEVDRAGNVAAIRVISGPLLLRDAAMDAVQHWRYKPYLQAGRPVSMSATAVMDFQLR